MTAKVSLRCFWMVVFIAAAVRIASPQDYMALKINEILASNSNKAPVPPADVDNEYEDMLEIYNDSDATVPLDNLMLTDHVVQGTDGKLHPVNPWKFQAGSILPRGFILVFCDLDVGSGGTKEPHVSFQLEKDGELVALFAPGDVLIDLKVFPHIPTGMSYGRYPDGADTWCYLQTPTFKNCSVITGGCLTAGNAGCTNVIPEVDLKPNRTIDTAQDAVPDPLEPVPLEAEAWDEVENPNGVDSVKILYRVGEGPEIEVPMILDPVATAALTKPDPMDGDPTDGIDRIPDPNRSVWKGEIPGQALGAVVTFTLQVKDKQGAIGIEPKSLCQDPPVPDCSKPFRYVVGSSYSGPLLLNEVCPLNITIIKDLTDFDFNDYIEIYSPVDLSLEGLWLSQNPYHPEAWQFPAGSFIHGNEYLVVWIDDDGTKTDASKGEYHATFNLNHDGDSIFIFNTVAQGQGLIDGLKFCLTKGDTAWSRIPDAQRTSPFLPYKDGSPHKPNPFPQFGRGDVDDSTGIDLADVLLILTYLFLDGAEFDCMDAADANDTGIIDIADPIYILTYLFGSGPTPPPPSVLNPGADPTDDMLSCRLFYENCGP